MAIENGNAFHRQAIRYRGKTFFKCFLLEMRSKCSKSSNRENQYVGKNVKAFPRSLFDVKLPL